MYQLSADLSDITGVKAATKAVCIKLVKGYIKRNNLYDRLNKQFFIPDNKLTNIFGADRLRLTNLGTILTTHLQIQDGGHENARYSTRGRLKMEEKLAESLECLSATMVICSAKIAEQKLQHVQYAKQNLRQTETY